MSRKFRWFVLASCVFVVVMGGREAIGLLAGGPQKHAAAPGRSGTPALAEKRRAPKPAPSAAWFAGDGELAQGEARQDQ